MDFEELIGSVADVDGEEEGAKSKKLTKVEIEISFYFPITIFIHDIIFQNSYKLCLLHNFFM